MNENKAQTYKRKLLQLLRGLWSCIYYFVEAFTEDERRRS